MTFPFHASDFNNSLESAIAINLLIYIVLLITVPSLFILVISFIKPKIKEKSNFYLYAFSSAIFIMIGTVGLIKEGFESSQAFSETLINFSKTSQDLVTAAIIGCGAIIGLTVAILFRYLFVKKSGEVHLSHENHSHDDHIFNLSDIDNPKAAWLVIFLILSHRTIDGFVMGGTIAKISDATETINLGLVITFNIHILIEALMVYYRQIQFGQKRWKAVLYNFYTLLALIPIMFIGAYINKYLVYAGWVLPLANISGGSVITFVGIIELVPEFLHHKKMSSKEWYKLIICFSVGIVFALVFLSLSHGSHSETEYEHIETQNLVQQAKHFVARYY
ncbi:MAG: ZIP family metal transporter [Malacoplasma sp.]|nr:ZIP family metal transporter [Malacoplasma sp.]MDE7099925.1 ZIP family metal transporter [Malacoplasma sp.]